MPVYRQENRLDSEESIAMNIRLLDLMKKTSYRILQVNGQRRYGGPPPQWSGPPPPKDSEVFVGKIPRNCFEDELVPVFSRVGQIYELRLMMDFSGTNRGYAFVMYTCPEEAEKAVNELNNYEIRPGRNIGVVRSTNNCKIYIGTLSGTVDRKLIKKTIKYLTEGVVDVKVHVAPVSRKRFNNSKKPHFVIAEYESHRAAAMARRRLLPARLELWGHEVSVEWANTIQK
ncbi:Sex-lethal homolog, partial [Gryllus bimaculatus]